MTDGQATALLRCSSRTFVTGFRVAKHLAGFSTLLQIFPLLPSSELRPELSGDYAMHVLLSEYQEWRNLARTYQIPMTFTDYNGFRFRPK